jgi:pilus assembly protein Flp/PilA
MNPQNFYSKEEGQGLVEYALILVLVAVVIIAITTLLGETIKGTYCRTVHQLTPEADLSSACQAPIAMPKLVDSGSNYINVEVDIYDPDGNQDDPYGAITKVEFYVDSTDSNPIKTELSYRYCLGGNNGTDPCLNFNTNGYSSGRHKIYILAYDSDGNIGRSGFAFTK